MTETPEEFRQRVERVDSKLFEDFVKRASPYREQGFEYEKLAVDYSHKAFQTLTYLNGGALVAIPTAMAFFKADIAKVDVMWTAGAFILGLLFVVLAQSAAFFTMAARAEAHDHRIWEQFHRVFALAYLPGAQQNIENLQKANDRFTTSEKRRARSNVWRWAGLICFGASLLTFIGGCGFGAKTVLASKQRIESQTTGRQR